MTSLTLLPESVFKVEAEPLFATPRNPHRDTLGSDVALVASRLGKPPMPWQQQLFDVAYELDPETGLLWYTEIVLLLMRQQGKSTVMVPVGTHRAIGWEQSQNILYTAQSRKAARRKWIKDQVPLLRASPFWSLIGEKGLRESNGDEGMTFGRGNGSWWGIDAPTETGGHGETLGLGLADEYWAHVDNRIEQAMSPAMITVDDAQKWFMSTAGTTRSIPLKIKRDQGRERVKMGLDSRSLYLEYAIPEDADVYDPANWARYMPALGHTIKEFKIQAEADSLDEAEFRRAYGNQWLDNYVGNWIIPEPDWIAVGDSDSVISGELEWCVDVAPDQAYSSISIAGVRDDGRIHVECVEWLPGTVWLPTRMAQLQRAYGGDVWADHTGPVGGLLHRFRDAGVELKPISGPDLARACSGFYDAVLNGSLRHIDQSELTLALASAARVKANDAWKWTRGRSLADISPLYSATIAHWKLAERLPDLNYDPLAGIS
jgi:hypothetical protein